MARKRNILLTPAIVALAAVVGVLVYQKEIRIAYHAGRLRASARYMLLESRNLTETPPKQPGFLKEQLIRLGHGDREQEDKAIERHTQALIELSYLVREEIPLQKRIYDGTNRIIFHQYLTNAFAFGTWEAVEDSDWWTLAGTQSNKIVITTTHALMPKWEKLVEDFDRP